MSIEISRRTSRGDETTYLRELLVAVLLGVLALGLNLVDFVASIIVVSFALVLVAIFLDRCRLVALSMLATLPYVVGPPLAARAGIVYYPRPGIEIYDAAAREQLIGLLLVVGLATATGLSQSFQRAFVLATARWRNDPPRPRLMAVVRISAFAIALVDLLVVLTNLGEAWGTRHSLADRLIVGNGPLGIILSLSLSLALVLNSFVAGKHRVLDVSLVAAMWLPTLIAGARNYLSVVLVVIVILIWTRLRSVSAKVLVVLAALFVIGALVVLPSIWSDNPIVSLNEWILPNSIFLGLYTGQFTAVEIGAGSFWAQWQLLLPGGLRSENVLPLADAFQQLGVTNVGVGGNPWGDTFVSTEWVRVLLFVLATCAVFALGVVLSRLSPIAVLVAFGLVVFWGRSSVWGDIAIIVGTTLVTAVLSRPPPSRLVKP